jgi:hypothetical protein
MATVAAESARGVWGAIVLLLCLYSSLTAAVAMVALMRHFAQTEADQRRRITESFIKAVDQLASDNLEERLGGIYTLERISKHSPGDCWTVMREVNCPWATGRAATCRPGWPCARSPQRMLESRFLSLLQSALLQTFSVVFWTAKKPNCRRHSRERLGGSTAERYGKSASEWPSLSEAWAWPIYSTSFFVSDFREFGSLGSRKVGIPFA